MRALKITMLTLGFSVLGLGVQAAEQSSIRPDASGNLSETEELVACEPARAEAYLRICNRFTTEPGTVRCIAAGRDRYFDECALVVCQRFTTEDGSVLCLEAARDKQYTTSEAQLCGRFTTENGAVGCLESAGRPHEGGDPNLTLREIRLEVAHILDTLAAGQVHGAGVMLEDLLARLDAVLRP